MPASSNEVEAVKGQQKFARLPCRDKSFDEALFHVTRRHWKRMLEDVSGLGEILESSPLFEAFRDYMIEQFEAIVDPAIQSVMASPNLTAGHAEWWGRKRRILSVHHNVIARRARHIVQSLEHHKKWWDVRKRTSGLRVTIAGAVNTTDWVPIVRDFWRLHKSSQAKQNAKAG